MDELGLRTAELAASFSLSDRTSYHLITVCENVASDWPALLGAPLRRCYITDELLDLRSTATMTTKSEILLARLPDPGATMAGDFGEILVYLYHATNEHPKIAFGPKKWRLKQDRTKPAPLSDVVHFVLPTWPNPSDQDEILCSEVKTKSTAGATTPITEAIRDCGKDRTSRLARTLVWLRERALTEDLGAVRLEHLDRFIKAVDYPPARRRFFAIAVVCTSVLEVELCTAPAEAATDHKVIVIAVPNLRETYSNVFDSAKNSLVAQQPSDGGAQ